MKLLPVFLSFTVNESLQVKISVVDIFSSATFTDSKLRNLVFEYTRRN